jgi:hypothetical protein
VAKFLRDDPSCAFDYASNVTGVDWPEKTIKEKVKVKKVVDGVEKEVEEVSETKTPGLSGSGLSSLLDGAQTRPAHPPPAHRKTARTGFTCRR